MKKKEKIRSTLCSDVTLLAARLLIASLFALSVFGKITGFTGSVGYFSSTVTYLPMPEFWIAAAVILELIGVISLVLGYRMQFGAWALVIYTITASVLFHIGDGQAIAFLKNMAVVGGLLVLSMHTPGKYSLEGK